MSAASNPRPEPIAVEGVNSFVFNHPIEAMEQAVRCLKADRESLMAEVAWLQKEVARQAGPM